MTRGHKLLIIGGVLAFLVLSAAAVAGGIYLLRARDFASPTSGSPSSRSTT